MARYAHLDPLAIKARLDAGERLRILDVREEEEWAICRIPGAELRPLSRFGEWAAELTGNTAPVVIHCHHGMRSQQVCEVLAAEGVEGLINLLGGIAAWADCVDPAMARY
jgi:adenylyltransferase/sulfurtransferase